MITLFYAVAGVALVATLRTILGVWRTTPRRLPPL